MCHRRPEESHDSVANELVHRAFVLLDRWHQMVEAGVDQIPHRFRVHGLRQSGET